AGEPEPGLRIIGALWHYWQAHGYLTEGEQWMDEVIRAAGTPEQTLIWTRALIASTFLLWQRGHNRQSRVPTEQALTIARQLGSTHYVAFALSALGTLLATTSDFAAEEEARRNALAEGLALNRQLGDVWTAAL